MIRFAIAFALLAACSKTEAPAAPKEPAAPAVPAPKEPAAAAPAAAPMSGKLEITVTEKGFEPDKLRVKAGEPVKLAFTRKTDKTCATEVVLQLGDGQKVEKKLPLGETVEIDATFAKAGELRYACAMDMIAGVVTVE
jgi:plastocyanin domain-containing protein